MWNISRYLSCAPETRSVVKLQNTTDARLCTCSELKIKGVEAFEGMDIINIYKIKTLCCREQVWKVWMSWKPRVTRLQFSAGALADSQNKPAQSGSEMLFKSLDLAEDKMDPCWNNYQAVRRREWWVLKVFSVTERRKMIRVYWTKVQSVWWSQGNKVG